MKKLYLLILIWLGVIAVPIAQTTVNIDQRTEYYYASYYDGGGYFNNSTDEVGLYANSTGTSKRVVLWRKLKTNADNTGSDRSLQIGDKIKLTFDAKRAYGRIGCALLSSPAVGGSWANRESNYAISVNLDGPLNTGTFWGNWYLKFAGDATSSSSFGGNQDTYYDSLLSGKLRFLEIIAFN